ncbi:MAG: DUF4338 domain-containing protein [Alphaproteobacteria bacterium]|nr:DUF4338 domain-containing protein [Alphaproteobacteria bacterium]
MPTNDHEIIKFDTNTDPVHSPFIRYCAIPLRVNTCKIIRFDNRLYQKMSPRQFRPRLPHQSLQRLHNLLAVHSGTGLAAALREAAGNLSEVEAQMKAEEEVILLVLADLAALGWRFRAVKGAIYMVPATQADLPPAMAKELLRRPLLHARDAQLAEASNKTFLESMHRSRKHKGISVTIENLVDDGPTLAAALKENRDGDLKKVVDPYLQLVDSTTRCEHTGLKLVDVWRYFRHTWSLVYRPTPGRTINFIVRNAARPHHPVIGIIGLANAVFQLASRDQWIGWTMERLVDAVKADPAHWSEFRHNAIDCLTRARGAIRSDDLFAEIGDVSDPLQIARRLETLAFQQGEARKEKLKASFDMDGVSALATRAIPKKNGDFDWIAASETELFKRKRAEVLADIIFALHVLTGSPEDGVAVANSIEVTKRPNGEPRLRWEDQDLERAVKGALREIKKNGVSTRILDVNVCGAAPTYREILGGKLTALTLFSEDVQRAYCQRYGEAVSEIASAMAGRPVSRPTRISILTTTSLYSVGSSQYNRVRMTVGGEVLEWKKIGETEGFGTVHIAPSTVDAIRRYAVVKQGMRNVNNKFGEGTSPLMRQLREGLTMLGFDSDDVLQHSNRRIVYALELLPKACRDLSLDKDSGVTNPPMNEVANVWINRWLTMRVKKDAVLEKVSLVTSSSVKAELLREDSRDGEPLSLFGEA